MALNEELKTDKSKGFSKGIVNLVAEDKIEDVNFESANTISFTAGTGAKSIVPPVIEVHKR